MKKFLIICSAGMSSSMIARGLTEKLKEKGHDIEVSAVDSTNAVDNLTSDAYDLYMISPQARIYFDEYKEMTKKPMVQIPPTMYVNIPVIMEKLADFVLEEGKII